MIPQMIWGRHIEVGFKIFALIRIEIVSVIYYYCGCNLYFWFCFICVLLGADRELQTVRQLMVNFLQNHTRQNWPVGCPPLDPVRWPNLQRYLLFFIFFLMFNSICLIFNMFLLLI